MKIFVFMLISLSSVMLGQTSISKLNEFYEIIDANYDEYYVFEKEMNVGDLVVCKGCVDDKYSLSIYFANAKSNDFFISITKNEKSYILSNSEYQIFYRIAINENDSYIIEVVSNNSKETYFSYELENNNFDHTGRGLNQFPYTTKLRNRVSLYALIFILVLCFIFIEAFIVLLIIIKKKKQKIKDNRPLNIVYETKSYEIESDNDES